MLHLRVVSNVRIVSLSFIEYPSTPKTLWELAGMVLSHLSILKTVYENPDVLLSFQQFGFENKS